MTDLHHFALLAPVPLEHLQSGRAVAEVEGYVALGTRKWELLRKLNDMRGDGRVAVLIYPSHEDAAVQNSYVVRWFGWYDGSEETSTGAHSAGMKHRPPTTAAYPLDNLGYWAAFWHVRGLRELSAEKRLPIGKLAGFAGGWRKGAPPRGPDLVTLPESLSYEI
jgi:hypothetical protein